VGDPADFIEVDNLESFHVQRTYIDGELVAEKGVSLLTPAVAVPMNRCVGQIVPVEAFRIPIRGDRVQTIEAHDGQLITTQSTASVARLDGYAVSDSERDLLKLVVVNRYEMKPPALAFVRGFGLKRGAIASSVAHDSHNVVAVGASDEDLCKAVNLVLAAGGGLSVADGRQQQLLTLPVAGLMSIDPIEKVATAYAELDQAVNDLGSELRAPFMTLSFMALLVIPEIKLSDRGLFDSRRFEMIPLFCD
jgi:adenine deaminase